MIGLFMHFFEMVVIGLLLPPSHQCLKSDKEIIELRVAMSPRMLLIQNAIQALFDDSVKELGKSRPELELDTTPCKGVTDNILLKANFERDNFKCIISFFSELI